MDLNDIKIHQDSDSDNTNHTPLQKTDPIEAQRAEERSREVDRNREDGSEDSFKALANVQKVKKSASKKSSKASEPVIVKSDSPRRRRNDKKDSDARSSVSRRSGSTSRSNVRYKKVSPEEENRDPDMREKKLDLLRKTERLCYLNKHQMRTDAIHYTFEEIENEFKKESLDYKNKQGTEMYKGILKVATTGLEMANTHLNPYADTMDIVGWSASVKNDVEAEQYDEVLSQLYEKYGTSVEWGPEWKLGFMLMQSAIVYAGTKHMTQNPSLFQGILGNMMGMPGKPSKFPMPQQKPSQQSQQSQQPQTNFRPPQQPSQQRQSPPQQQRFQQPMRQPNIQIDDDTDTTDDVMPSKMNEIDYTDILQKMRTNNSASTPQYQQEDTSEPPPPAPKKRMGRPRKNPLPDNTEPKPKRRPGRPRKIQPATINLQ